MNQRRVPRSQRMLWKMGEDIERRLDEFATVPGEPISGLKSIGDVIGDDDCNVRAQAAAMIALGAPGLTVSIIGSFAAGSVLGYCAGNGSPAAGQGLTLALIPVGGAGLSCVTPLVFEYGLDPLPPLATAGAIGSAACLGIGYGLGYLAGRFT